MTRVELVEARVSRGVKLTSEQARALSQLKPLVRSMAPGCEPGTFDVEVGNRVGVVQVADLELVIVPKLPTASLLWLVGYAATGVKLQSDARLLPSQWLEAFAAVYVKVTQEAIMPGLLRGYWSVEATDTTLRGRLRLAEQIRRHHARMYPLELTYDEYGIDIAENQLILAATTVLLDALRLAARPTAEHQLTTAALHNIRRRLNGVTPLVPGAPTPSWRASTLNQRYHAVLELSELVLTGQGLGTEHGQLQAKGFVIDTPAVFERAFARAVQELLPDGTVELQRSDQYILDRRDHRLRPDVVLTRQGEVWAVLDTKYKNASPKPADIYQMHVYASYYHVDHVHLVYAEHLPDGPTALTIKGTNTTIHCHGINLDTPALDFLGQVQTITRALGLTAARTLRA